MAVLLFFLLLLIPAALPPESAPGADPVVLTDHLDSYAVGPHLEYLEDPEGQWTLSDEAAAPISAAFESSRRAVPRFGYTGSTYWLRFCDDGCGFDPETVERGNGLRNLMNRARDLRAVLQLDTSPGGPTCCTINIPLRPPSRPNLNGWRRAASNRFHAEAVATTMNRPR